MDKDYELEELAQAVTPYAFGMAYHAAKLAGATDEEILEAAKRNSSIVDE